MLLVVSMTQLYLGWAWWSLKSDSEGFILKYKYLETRAFVLTDTVITLYLGRETKCWQWQGPVQPPPQQSTPGNDRAYLRYLEKKVAHHWAATPREMDPVLPPGMPQQHDDAEDDSKKGAPHNERRADGEQGPDWVKRLRCQTPPTAAELRKIRMRP